MEGERRNINPALWLECAGPLITLPSIGSHVVYFPQGHSEQVIASTQKEAEAQIPSYPNLPAQLICQLHNVTLHADQENDEVYAQMTLQPVNGQQQVKDLFLSPDHGIQPKQPTISFSKTLTASDTSTHGGFSIPRRAAEKVFPPLDYNKQPPAQELVARDLHNNEWHFRHIYRGQPRRHLLTTGWSVFVSAKRLQAGDTVLFMRDESGQLLLGIRRANRQQTNMPSSLLSSDSMLIGVLAAAAHAASTSSRFTIFYNPRASPSEFVIPLARYNKAIYHTQVSVGMRFRMEMETEDSSTRRYMGTITGIGDLDSSRWPGSYWRSLKVGWDESTAGQRQRRVSLWEIEPLTAPFLLCNPSLLLRPKRLRPGEDDLEASMKRSIWGRAEDSMNFSGMGMEHWLRLQQRPDAVTPAVQPDYYHAMAVDALQEIRTAHSKQLIQQHNPPVIQFQQMQFGAQNQQAQLPPIIQTSKQQMQQQHSQGQQMQLPNLPTDSMMQNPTAVQQTSLNLPSAMRSSANYGESEISHAAVPPFSLQSILTKGNQGNLVGDEDTEFPPLMRPNQSYMQKQQPGMLPGSGLITQENQAARNWMAAMKDTGHPDAQQMSFSMPRPDSSGQVPLGPAVHSQSNPHDQESVQSDPRSSHLLFGVSIDGPLAMSDAASSFQQVGFTKGKDMQSQFMTCSTSGSEMQMNANMVMNGNLDENGFLQQASNWPQQVYPPPVRTFTKVHKLGSVGRSLDVTRFKTYEDLRAELARMFNLEGQLDEPRSGWQVVFVDNENDMLLLGDDPWEEFVSCVRCIKILSPSEVLQMNQEQMGWLSSVQVQPRQTSSSSDDCIMRQDHRNILGQESHMPSGNMTTGPRNPGMGSNYSDPSCISDGI